MGLKDQNDPVGDLQLTSVGTFITELTAQVNKYVAEQVANEERQITFLQKALQERDRARTKSVSLASKRALGVINKYL